MKIEQSIFKAYDIRGIVDETLTEDAAQRIGFAFACALASRGLGRVAVGRDGRLSGPRLQSALTQGLRAGGAAVLDLGMVTTPMLYFAAATTDYTSAIQITGSHNPSNYNGFKMVIDRAAIYGDAIQELAHAAPRAPREYEPLEANECLDITQAYTHAVCKSVKLARPLKIVLDAGNGVGGASAPAVLRALGCTVQELFCEVNGRFPNHHPDPAKLENLQALIHAVQSSDAELGLALDGDGDRLGVVTRSGAVIYPDRQLGMFAQDVLSRHPGAPIVFDVKCSANLARTIRAAGGVPHMDKTGHSLIKAKMKSLGSPLAGEMSGHIFWGERWYGFDDGTYTAARLLEIVSRSADPSAILEALPNSIATPEINLACAEGQHHQIAARMQALDTSASFPTAIGASRIDGLRLEYEGGFSLIRASNTTPVLVLRLEAASLSAIHVQRRELQNALAAVLGDEDAAARYQAVMDKDPILKRAQAAADNNTGEQA